VAVTRTIQTTFQIDEAPAYKVLRFQESHKLGVPASLEIDVAYTDYYELEAMVGQKAALSYGYEGDEPRKFAGIVESVALKGSGQQGMDGRLYRYVVRVVPKIALLDRSVDSRIFQDMDVKEIVTKVLESHDIAGPAVSWKLVGSYPKREYCVQYQESSLAFISRLLEEEGIYYTIEAGDDEEVIVLTDDSTVADAIAGDPEIVVKPRTSLVTDTDAIYWIADARRVRSGKFVLRDYNFEKPQLDLTSTAEGKEHTNLEVYDYPGIYLEPAEGKRLAQTRLEAEQSSASTIAIKAECMRLFTGKKITVTESTNLGGSLDGDWVVTSLDHDYDGSRGESAGKTDSGFSVHATLLPADVKYRSPRRTPVPVIEGPQTARVVAPDGSPMETIHTDKHGRVKVKFHWDRTEVKDDKASCWIRVQQLQTSGSMVIPRIEWEVIVEYLEGNPDRPVVTGRLYNGVYMPPYALPEGKTRTTMRTATTPSGGGSNEIRFEDKAGSEEIMIHAQYDMHMVTANNKKKTIGNNETLTVKNNSSLEVGSNQDVKITKGAKAQIGANQTVSVGGNRNVEVNAVTGLTAGGNAKISVGGNQFEMDGNPLEALLNIAAAKAVEFLTAKANEAIGKIEGHVQSAVDQALGPVNNLAGQVGALGAGMQAVANGDMSAMAGMVGNAAGVPNAGQMMAAMGGGHGSGNAPNPLADIAGTLAQPQNLANQGIEQGSAAAQGAAAAGIKRGVGAARNALGAALGLDSGGGGGESLANEAGPVGDVGGVDQTDREKGPGHSTAVIKGKHSETIGGLKIRGVLMGIDTNVGANMTQTIGAAQAEIVIGKRTETVGGNKDEKAIGLVVLSKAGESEKVGGSKTTMVGGLIYDKLKGSHSIEAGGPATFIGAFHKIEAKTKITFKCGPSSVVIDGSGFTVKAPLVTVLAGKIQLPKKVSEL
jgi:type VI secretion system secreted protein VgrG